MKMEDIGILSGKPAAQLETGFQDAIPLPVAQKIKEVMVAFLVNNKCLRICK